MDEDHEFRHSCKFCNKKFSNGRALGGHMRSHMTLNSAESEEKLQRKKPINGGTGCNFVGNSEENVHPGYVLRENPKKTWRFSDSGGNTVLGQFNRICKDCGKGFHSLKALFGHMRCHSERVSQSFDADSWSEENQPVLDSQSDNEGAPKRRRSRRTRFGTTRNVSFVSDEQEQEELAICLMMLSRDVGFCGGICVAESSDNNSASVEVRSRLNKEKKPINGGSDHDHELDVSDAENSGFDRKKPEFDVSASGFLRGELKSPKFDVSDAEFQKGSRGGAGYGASDADLAVHEYEFEVSNAKIGRDFGRRIGMDASRRELHMNMMGKTRFDSSDTEMEMKSVKKTRVERSDTNLGRDSTNRTGFDRFDSESRKHFCKRTMLDASDAEQGKDHCKQARYECSTCNKVFHSYQALGGHRASHKKVKGCFAKIETSEHSDNTELPLDSAANDKLKSCRIENVIERGGRRINGDSNFGSKKMKVHECPICLRVFASGQALGGHKRSHLVPVCSADIRDNVCTEIVIHQKIPEISALLDLNLPAPDEEGHERVRFKSWWISNEKQEQLGDEGESQMVADKALAGTENGLVSSKHANFHSLTTPPRPCLQV